MLFELSENVHVRHRRALRSSRLPCGACLRLSSVQLRPKNRRTRVFERVRMGCQLCISLVPISACRAATPEPQDFLEGSDPRTVVFLPGQRPKKLLSLSTKHFKGIDISDGHRCIFHLSGGDRSTTFYPFFNLLSHFLPNGSSGSSRIFTWFRPLATFLLCRVV